MTSITLEWANDIIIHEYYLFPDSKYPCGVVGADFYTICGHLK